MEKPCASDHPDESVVCFGEILLRLSPPGRGLLIQAPSLDVHTGGAEANVAVALARLGRRSRMVSALPPGPLGDRALGALASWGVDVGGVLRAPGRMGLYFVSCGASLRPSQVLYDREGSAFAEAPAGAYDWPRLLAGAARLHLSGITPALGPGPAHLALQAVEAAREAGLEVSFDCNYRARLWGAWDAEPRAILGRIVREADLLFGDDRDIALLLGRGAFDGEDGHRSAAAAAFAAFPRLKAIASTKRVIEHVDCHRIRARIDTPVGFHETAEIRVAGIIDRIGAGDAFAAGVLDGLICGLEPAAAAEAGLALSCLKHSIPGDAALVQPADLEAFGAGGLEVRR